MNTTPPPRRIPCVALPADNRGLLLFGDRMSAWRKVSDVPGKPVSALIAFIDPDGEATLSGQIAIRLNGHLVDENTGEPISLDCFWLDEDALFKAIPLRVKGRRKQKI